MLLDFCSNRVDRYEYSNKKVEAPAVSTTVEEVFFAHVPRVHKVARRMLNNDADAEDVTQEVFLQVVRKLDTFRGEAALSTWLNRVTVNACLLHRRKAVRRRERQVDTQLDFLPEHERVCAAVSPRNAPDQQMIDEETQALIERAIAGLPDIYRAVYVLAEVENLPNATIGEQLNLEVPAVKSRLHRARLMMREALAVHFEAYAR